MRETVFSWKFFFALVSLALGISLLISGIGAWFSLPFLCYGSALISHRIAEITERKWIRRIAGTIAALSYVGALATSIYGFVSMHALLPALRPPAWLFEVSCVVMVLSCSEILHKTMMMLFSDYQRGRSTCKAREVSAPRHRPGHPQTKQSLQEQLKASQAVDEQFAATLLAEYQRALAYLNTQGGAAKQAFARFSQQQTEYECSISQELFIQPVKLVTQHEGVIRCHYFNRSELLAWYLENANDHGVASNPCTRAPYGLADLVVDSAKSLAVRRFILKVINQAKAFNFEPTHSLGALEESIQVLERQLKPQLPLKLSPSHQMLTSGVRSGDSRNESRATSSRGFTGVRWHQLTRPRVEEGAATEGGLLDSPPAAVSFC